MEFKGHYGSVLLKRPKPSQRRRPEPAFGVLCPSHCWFNFDAERLHLTELLSTFQLDLFVLCWWKFFVVYQNPVSVQTGAWLRLGSEQVQPLEQLKSQQKNATARPHRGSIFDDISQLRPLEAYIRQSERVFLSFGRSRSRLSWLTPVV